MAEGHRARLKKRFLNDDLDNFEPHNALELLLFYALPRVDTNPIAHRLIEKFGSFSAVLQAPKEEIASVEGMGENAAVFLKVINSSFRYYEADRRSIERLTLDTPEKIGSFLVGKYAGLGNERVSILLFDNKRRLIEMRVVYEGSVTSAGINIRQLAEIALFKHASFVILAHNHPNGIAFPSVDDLAVTDALRKALELLEITLADHYIIADDEYITVSKARIMQKDSNPLLRNY